MQEDDFDSEMEEEVLKDGTVFKLRTSKRLLRYWCERLYSEDEKERSRAFKSVATILNEHPDWIKELPPALKDRFQGPGKQEGFFRAEPGPPDVRERFRTLLERNDMMGLTESEVDELEGIKKEYPEWGDSNRSIWEARKVKRR